MFVRRKKNRSGTTSVVVVDKQGGKFKELHTVGVSCDETEIDRLCLEGREWIKSHLGIMELDFDGSREFLHLTYCKTPEPDKRTCGDQRYVILACKK